MTTLTQKSTDPSGVEPTATVPPGAGRARAGIVAGALVAGALVSLGLGIWHPEPNGNDEFTYDIVEPIRDSWWAWHVFGGIGTAVAALAASIAVCLLVRRRGAAFANVGAVLASLGGIAFGAGVAAEGVLFAYVTDPDVLPADTGTSLMTYFNDNPERFLVAILPGVLLLTFGALLLAVALWRAGTVPRWLPLAFGVANLAGFVAPFGTVASAINAVFTASLLAIAWHLWRSTKNVVVAASPTHI